MIAVALACLFIGDSTAQGAAQAFNRIARLPCPVVARIGAGAAEVASWQLPNGPARFVIIGAGSNDPTAPGLRRDLWARRQTIQGARVVWLLPYHRGAAATVESVATSWGDYVLDLAELPSRDQLHPTTYQGIATALRRLGVE